MIGFAPSMRAASRLFRTDTPQQTALRPLQHSPACDTIGAVPLSMPCSFARTAWYSTLGKAKGHSLHPRPRQLKRQLLLFQQVRTSGLLLILCRPEIAPVALSGQPVAGQALAAPQVALRHHVLQQHAALRAGRVARRPAAELEHYVPGLLAGRPGCKTTIS